MCAITNGSSFALALEGVGKKARVDFSSTTVDFGRQFLWRKGMPPARHVLVIRNNDLKEVGVETAFDSTEFLRVEAPPTLLSPGATMEVPVTFMPRDTISYSETVWGYYRYIHILYMGGGGV